MINILDLKYKEVVEYSIVDNIGNYLLLIIRKALRINIANL